MNLELKNVGKINQANIDFDGITVVAGENNTGKSTIGKMLFCVFHSFYRIEDQVVEERVKTISRVLANFYHETANRFTRRFEVVSFAETIVYKRDIFLKDVKLLIEEVKGFYLSKDKYFQQYINQESIEQLAEKLLTFLKLEDNEIRKIILRKRLEAEFAMKIGHINNVEEKASVKLNIKDSCINFEIIKNEDININDYMNLNKEIIYIDDPFILDDINKKITFSKDQFRHRQDLLQKIAEGKNTTDFTLVDELVVKQKLEKILGSMNEVCDGNLLADEGENLVYTTDKLNGNLEMVNLSTGMKSFVILRQLLQNGSINENGMIILDEPEIHLHPEWQLKFAEIIVLIQKEFGANILLNTHSPYFMNAIEVYSHKYGIDKKCRYYLIDEKDGNTIVTNVTDNSEAIYAKLARPLQELENLEYRNENTI